jgi:hypothetical protein
MHVQDDEIVVHGIVRVCMCTCMHAVAQTYEYSCLKHGVCTCTDSEAMKHLQAKVCMADGIP